MMNWIWLGLIIISILCAGFTGNMPELTLSSFEAAKDAVWLALKLIGIMALWLGIMQVAQKSGLMKAMARALKSPMRWLFPDVPSGHPAMSAMIMNFGANMLGLANAATPFGIKAMVELDKLNPHKGTPTNAMCLFLAINTSSLSLLATGTIGIRAAAGSSDPACIWLPSLLASACSTIVAIVITKILQRLRIYQLTCLQNVSLQKKTPSSSSSTQNNNGLEEINTVNSAIMRVGVGTRVFIWVSVLGFLGAGVYHFVCLAHKIHTVALGIEEMHLAFPVFSAYFENAVIVPIFDVSLVIKDFFSFWAIPLLMGGLLLHGIARGVRVYEVMIEGAKQGFEIAVRIIPYLVAIIVAVDMFSVSGAMDLMRMSVGRVTEYLGMPTEALPMAIIRPLSGNGAFGYMSSVFTQYGPDSFVGKLVSVMQGSTETTLYVLAVYFGSVQIYRVRHALVCGLSADLAGIVASVALANVFF